MHDADPREVQWLGSQDLALVDLTRRGRDSNGRVLVRVTDPTLPLNDFSRYRLLCPPSLRRHVIEQMHTKGHWGINKTV